MRALRHWHQVGVLPEPERRRNGYRDYGVADLVRVLRINRLAALGMPLERMAEVLDSEASDGRASASGLLEQLDGELAEQIERLERQRDLIAVVRRHDASPDVPPELAPVAAALIAAGLSSPMARFDRDQSVLLAHLAGRDGLSRLVGFFERLVEPDRTAAVAIVMNRFGSLDEESPETEVDDVVAALTELSVELSAELAAGPEAGYGVGREMSVDAGPETGSEAGREAVLDAAVAAGTDAGCAVGADAGCAVGADAGHAVGADAGHAVGADAGHAVGADAGCAVGADAGHATRGEVGGETGPVPATASIDLGVAAPVIGAYAADVLNDTQRRVLDRVGAALDAASPPA